MVVERKKEKKIKRKNKKKLDKEKIEKVIEQNGVKVFILLKEHLTKEYITRII